MLFCVMYLAAAVVSILALCRQIDGNWATLTLAVIGLLHCWPPG